MARQDLTGQRFGRLTVVRLHHVEENRHRTGYWLCRCDDGNALVVRAGSLKSGNTRSCGCLRVSERQQRNFRHGMAHTPFYNVYQSLQQRCTDPQDRYYTNYGGRGIRVEWADFLAFKRDMYAAYLRHIATHGEENTSIDRCDNDGPYSKKNCRWATRQQQANNKRSNRRLTYNGVTCTLSQWAKRVGVTPSTLAWRLRCWSLCDALTRPAKR